MSRRMRFIAAGLGLLVIIVAAWFLLLSPVRQDIDLVSANIEQEQTKLTTAMAKLSQAEITRAEGQENQARLLELAKMVPSSQEIPSLMLQIQDLADQSGIEFISVTPGPPIAEVGYEMIPLSLEFSGTYFDMSDLVYRVEQLVAGPGRLLAVKQIDLQLSSDESLAAGSVSPPLNVRVVLYAFQSQEAAITTAAIPVDSAPVESSDELGAGSTGDEPDGT